LVIEFYGVIHVIEEAKKMGLTSLWLECDFVLVCAAFTTKTKVHWILRNRWNTCLDYCEKSGLGFLAFFVKVLHFLNNLLI